MGKLWQMRHLSLEKGYKHSRHQKKRHFYNNVLWINMKKSLFWTFFLSLVFSTLQLYTVKSHEKVLPRSKVSITRSFSNVHMVIFSIILKKFIYKYFLCGSFGVILFNVCEEFSLKKVQIIFHSKYTYI